MYFFIKIEGAGWQQKKEETKPPDQGTSYKDEIIISGELFLFITRSLQTGRVVSTCA